MNIFVYVDQYLPDRLPQGDSEAVVPALYWRLGSFGEGVPRIGDRIGLSEEYGLKTAIVDEVKYYLEAGSVEEDGAQVDALPVILGDHTRVLVPKSTCLGVAIRVTTV